MEEKKFDSYQFIGFILIALILTWMLYRNNPENSETEKNRVTNTQKIQSKENIDEKQKDYSYSDSLTKTNLKKSFGNFGSLFFKTKTDSIIIENDKIEIQITTKGANISSLRLKEFENYNKEPLYLINKNNTDFNIDINLLDGRIINTKEMNFKPSLEKRNNEQRLVFKAEISNNQYISFIYTLPNQGYIVSLEVESYGMSGLLSDEKHPKAYWKTNTFRNSKSIDYENRYTELTFGYETDRVDYLSLTGNDQENREDIRWISYRQHFFSSIIVPEFSFKEVFLKSSDLVSDESLDNKFTKAFESEFDIDYVGGDFHSRYKFYYGPTDYKTLKNIEGDLEASIPLGWGIFGWINRFVFLPLFGFISSYLPFGVSIIVMTIIVRLAMSPVTYKSYVSQIKMKLLRPDVEEITAKHKDDAVKRQQETMSLYNRAGANPMSGCVPALIQLPVFYALFSFFPVAFVLRQKSFLWADDLSSYDSIYELPFNIPFYGDHISLFPILASIAIFFYTKMTTGQQPMPQQPGMPNMKVIMYLMPLMMLFFFNNYASGLSLYYFVSNLLTILLMLIIKNYIIDDNKIHAKIEENKKKPKKTSGFSARLQKAMEEAEKQKKSGNKYRR
jgi:YidC/Oxa1 family membrane protein insertase